MTRKKTTHNGVKDKPIDLTPHIVKVLPQK